MGNTVNIYQNFLGDKQLESSSSDYYTSEWAHPEDYKLCKSIWSTISNSSLPDECLEIDEPIVWSFVVQTKAEIYFWKTFRKLLCEVLPQKGINYTKVFDTACIYTKNGDVKEAHPGCGIRLVRCLLKSKTDTRYFMKGITEVTYALYECNGFKSRDLFPIGEVLCRCLQHCLSITGRSHAYTEKVHMAWVRLYSSALRFAMVKAIHMPRELRKAVLARRNTENGIHSHNRSNKRFDNESSSLSSLTNSYDSYQSRRSQSNELPMITEREDSVEERGLTPEACY